MRDDATTSIDDLLHHDADDDGQPVEQPADRRSLLGWLVRTTVTAAALTAVLVYGFTLVGVRLPLVPVFAACLALLLLRHWVRQLAAPPPPTRSARGGWTVTDDESRYNWRGHDGLRAAIRRWESRLDAVHSDPARFSRTVLPVLAELTDERLRQRHGITRATDPQRARELLGESLWQLLSGTGRPPRRRELVAHVDRLAQL